MKVKPWFVIKAPIEGVRFSNEEVGLEIEFELEDRDWESLDKEMTAQVKAIATKYFDKLGEEVANGQSEVLNALKAKLSNDYDEILLNDKREIIKLRTLLKDNGIQYK